MSKAMSHSELEAFFQEHANYYRTCNAQGMISQYQHDAFFWEGGGSNLNGVSDIQNWFAIMFSQWDIESVEYELAAQRVQGNLASCACFWSVRCCEKEAEASMQSVLVRSTYCLEKIDGTWKIWHVHSGV